MDTRISRHACFVAATALAIVACMAPRSATAQQAEPLPILPVLQLRRPPAPAEGVVAPLDMARAPDGEIYVLDGEGCRVIRLDAEDRLRDLWGGCGDGQGRLYRPFAIAAGPEQVYVAELSRESRYSFGDSAQRFDIEVFDRRGRHLRTLRASRALQSPIASGRWSGGGSEPLMRALHEPVGLDIAADGTLHVLDAKGRRWSRYDADGTLLDAIAPEGEERLRDALRPNDLADRGGRVVVGEEDAELFAIWPARESLLRYSRAGDAARAELLEPPPNGGWLRDLDVGPEGGLLLASGQALHRREASGRWRSIGPPAEEEPPVLALAAAPGGAVLLRERGPRGREGLALQELDEAPPALTPRWGRWLDLEGWLDPMDSVVELTAGPEGGVTILSRRLTGGAQVDRIDELGRYERGVTLEAEPPSYPDPRALAEWPDGSLALYDASLGGRILRFDERGAPRDALPAKGISPEELLAAPDGALLALLLPTPLPTPSPVPTYTAAPYPPPRTATPIWPPYPPPLTPRPHPTRIRRPTPLPTSTRVPERRVIARIDEKGSRSAMVLRMEAEDYYWKRQVGKRFVLGPDGERLLLLDRSGDERTLIRHVDARDGRNLQRIPVDPQGNGRVWNPSMRELRTGPAGELYAVARIASGPERLWRIDGDGRIEGGWRLGLEIGADHFALDREGRLWTKSVANPSPRQSDRFPSLALQLWAPHWPGEWHASLFEGRHLAGTPLAIAEPEAVDLAAAFGPRLAPLLTSGSGASARFERPVALPGGRYAIQLRGQGGARLWLDGEVLVDRWHEAAYDETVERFLPGTGARRFVLETRSAVPEDGGAMDVALSWERLGEAHAIFLPWGTTELGPRPIPLPSAPPPSPAPEGYPGP